MNYYCEFCRRSISSGNTCCILCDETLGTRHCKNCRDHPCIEDYQDYHQFQLSCMQKLETLLRDRKHQQNNSNILIVPEVSPFHYRVTPADLEVSLCDYCKWKDEQQKKQ